ncbi:UNVERIFIED_CONTAM: hypothetical protein PYX00_009609 [Menopon gallinae]|uniref:Uncharacterized protein n=1 Tax=Menopon gallinae TaxID=328185 RepID=A0AAW2HCK3_9NEOP
MACVVLPSETARLVYGYLMKEKLDNIALQFLENSPYLTDCYHIVKSGYQFNTKFLYKELHELIQEYSTIQNLVDKKIGLLPKTSNLYKRIKLQCENLSEMIDLILFWKCSESKSEDISPVHKNVEQQLPQSENKTDKPHELNVNSDNLSIQDSVCNDYISANNSPQSETGQAETDNVFNESACTLDSKSDKNDFGSKEVNSNSVRENVNLESAKSGVILDGSKRNQNIQGESQDTVNEISKDNSNVLDISMSSIDPTNMDKANDMEVLISNEPDASADRQIKIVRIENDYQGNPEKNQLPNTFAQNMEGMESNMGLDNNSVLYVAPDVGNLINHDNRNQIIVIPIDYYKSQNEVGNPQNQVQNLGGNLGNNVSANNEIIFEDVGVTPSLMPVSTAATFPCSNVEKKSFVDDNIVTEGTYLKNKEIIYELENKVKAQIFQQAPPVKEPEPAPVSTIFVTQLIEKPDRRHRRILPRRDPVIQPNPIVVVQPLIEKKSVVRTSKSNPKGKKCIAKKNNKSVPENNLKVNEPKSTAVLDMPSIRTPVRENDQKLNDSKGSEEKVQESQNNEKLNEEKENLETGDNKIETPTVIVKRNCKRLSLSTPRRKSHIRALEFETPPKSGNAKKKSRTSPKIKVEEVKVKNKNVRNTLFKSPDLDTSFKTPSCLTSEKNTSVTNEMNTSVATTELPNTTTTPSLPRRSPNNQIGEGWENVTGISCLLGDAENKPKVKKSWDSDLRDFIVAAGTTITDTDSNEKKRTRKPKKGQKDDKKSTKKQSTSPKKCKTPQILPSPSKISLTAKRNTYSISGNEEGSPVRSLFEELDFVTPFKDTDSIRPAEETPLTKLFRENVNGLDIDLNTINTPIFPPTPSIIITPDVEDSLPMAGTYYYSPLKDSSKEKAAKVESFKNEAAKKEEITESDRKKGAKEAHEKVIGELVSKAKEIVGLRSVDSEDHVIKKPPSGKVLSMVKIQMITQCDKKLYENIPINEESVSDATTEQVTLIEKISEEAAKFDLKCELEEKRQRALRKLKSVKENFTPAAKKKVKRSPVKRKRNCDKSKSAKRVKRDSQNETSVSEKTNESSGGIAEDVEIFHSTPYADRTSDREDSSEKVDRSMLEEIREEFPPFEDDGEFPELPVKTRKKLHYIHHFLKSEEVLRYLENFNEKKSPRLKLKRSHRKFFQVFYKWLKHPHSREVNTSDRTKSLFKEYRNLFEKIKVGVSLRLGCQMDREDGLSVQTGAQIQLSDDDDFRLREKGKKKEEDVEDGPVSILPLKKRKATVQPLEVNGTESSRSAADKTPSAENTSRTQTFLQDIDVDRFLSQIHGQENR